MSGCAMSPYIKTSDGKVVESKLFNDLFSTFKSRGKAWKYYGIATNPKFLSSITEQIETDSNGEITMESFFRVASLRTNGDKAVALLEKSLGLKDDKYSYEDAIAKVNAFNRHNTENPGYMATMVLEQDGNYSVHIVQRNSRNKEYLKKTIKDKLIKDKLTEHLNKAGVAINMSASESRYMIGENIERTANGLCQLIDFCGGDSSQVFAEEAGHFVIGAATKTPLYERLMNLLDKVDLHEIFTEAEIRSAFATDTPMRELAGRLVGKSIHNKLEHGPIKNLIDRIFSSVKRLFAKMSSNQIKKDLLEIQDIATNLAEAFVGDNIEGSLSNALSYLEKREHSELKEADNALTNAIDGLNSLVENLNNIGETWLAEAIQNTIIDITEQYSSGFALDAHKGITLLVMHLSHLLQSERESAEAAGITAEFIMSSNPTQFMQEVAKVAPRLVKLRTIIQASAAVMNAIEQVIKDDSAQFKETTLDINGVEVNPHFYEHYNDLLELLSSTAGSFADVILSAERTISLGHLKFLLGADYIKHADKLLFKGRAKANRSYAEELLDYVSGTGGAGNGWLWNLLGTCANSPDVVSQLYNQAMQQANIDADRATELDFHKLEAHRKKLKDIGLSTRDQHIFFEKTKDGKLTNNLITDIRVYEKKSGITETYTVRWHLFEQELEDLRKSEYKKWYQDNKVRLEKLPKTAQDHLFRSHFAYVKTKWLKDNAVWDYSKKCHVPSPYVKDAFGEYKYRYDNPLTAEQKQWLQEHRKILDDINSRIDDHLPVHRAPQFSATFTNIIQNKIRERGNVVTGIAVGLWNWMKNAIMQENNPEFFGSEETYNDDSDRSKSMKTKDKEQRDSIFVYSETIRRIPLFGVNKIQNTSNMSTDLISATIAYAQMVNKNSANSKIEHLIRLGLDYRKTRADRQVSSSNDANYRADIDRTLHRLTGQVDKMLFGVGMKRTKLGHHTSSSLNMITRALSMFASKKFLGGNVSGGLVNLGTGTLELFKEAFAGEHFTVKELNKAMQTYFSGVGGAIGDHYLGDDTSKISLFGKRYLITSADEFKYMNRGSQGERVAETLVEDFFMLPYSVGEHFMQTVPFIALAQKKILYREDGSSVSLWDALTVQDDKYQEYDKALENFKDVDTGQKTLGTHGLLFSSKYGGKYYKELLEDIELFKTKTKVTLEELNPYTRQFLKDKGIQLDVVPYNTIAQSLEQEAYELTYNKAKDANFQRKARDITNNMHGVYNSTDKTYAQRTLYGSMLLTMRGYALGLLEKNYGVTGYRVSTGQESEGVMRTLAKVFNHALFHEDELYGKTDEETPEGDPIYKKGWRSSNGRRLLWYASLGLIFQKEKAAEKLKEAGVAADLSEDAAPGAAFQYRNLRRALFGRLASYLLAILWALGMSGEDDEEENEVWWYTSGILRYFASRIFLEQIAFTTGQGVVSEINSTNITTPAGFSAFLGTLEDMGLLLGSLIWDKYDENSFMSKLVRYKKYNGEKNVSKSAVRLQKSLPYYKEFMRWRDPHKASESVLWARDQKNM